MKQIITLCHQRASALQSQQLMRVLLLALSLFLVDAISQSIIASGQAVEPIATPASNTLLFPNDPSYQDDTQYALDMINIESAWRYTHGDPNMTVALLDTGIDFTHPELADHIHPDGYSFVGQSMAQDQNGHGTLAAGIIGAAIHNNLGTAGIASNVQILPIQVSSGSTRQGNAIDEMLSPTYGFAEPIRYAASPARNGTRVMNINFATGVDDQAERAAIAEATQSGVLVVAAAGNTGQNRALFPAAYDCVLGVGAVDRNAQRASFSTYGLGVDVVAPGVAIYGTDLMGPQGYSTDDYTFGSGTSYAAPHATGVAALLFSARPDLSAWDVSEIMMRSAKDLGPLGFDAEYGYGLLDAGAAMELAKVWQANSSKAADHCTGDRYRVYGSLYLDQNQNGARDASDSIFAEPYGATTTYVELYGRNGAHRLDVTYPNAAGIFTFDVVYNTTDAPYTIKLQNSTVQQKLFFSAGMSGPYNIDMLTVPDAAVTVQGALFLDDNGDGIRTENEAAYQPAPQTPATVGLYAVGGQTPLAKATSDSQGNFVLYVAPPTTTVTYELREAVVDNALQGNRLHTITLDPTTAPVVTYAIGVAIATNPSGENAQMHNPVPTNLQVITHTGSIVLTWTTPAALNSDSIFEVAYARQSGGPYQALGTTALAQTTHYTLFDLPTVTLPMVALSSAATDGDYYFVVRARTPNEDTTTWSDYSAEAVLRTSRPTPPTQLLPHQLFLPLVQR